MPRKITRRFCIRHGSINNQAVVYIRLANRREFFTDLENWHDYIRLGFSQCINLENTGNGHRYPRSMAHCPDPKAPRSRTQTLARLFVAIRMIREEMAGGERADDKGWVVRHANGNTCDLRSVNLLNVPSRGHRNGYSAVWNVRTRWCLVEQGLDPNDVFAKQRKADRAKRGPK